jgi:hypothetical protein
VTYAVVAHLAFAATTLWAIDFLADVRLSPTTVDGSDRRAAWLVDLALLGRFAVQPR